MVNLFVFLFYAILAILLVKGLESKGDTVVDKVESQKMKDSSIRRIVKKSLSSCFILKTSSLNVTNVMTSSPKTNLIRAPMC